MSKPEKEERNEYKHRSRPPSWKVCLNKVTGELVPWVNGSWSRPEDAKNFEAKYNCIPADTQFMATLKISRGLRAWAGTSYVCWVDTMTGLKYNMSFENFVKAIRNADLYQGELTGVWGYLKRGKRQTVYLVKEIEFDEDGMMVK